LKKSSDSLERKSTMKRTGFLFDRRYLLHETGSFHPEVPERLTAIYQGIEDGGLLPKLTRVEATPAELRWIETVHDKGYIDRFNDACIQNKKMLDTPDNQMCAETYATALLAVGGILNTVQMVMEDRIDNAFCAVRPPGHHAEIAEAMGFCYFNNVAIAARYLQQQWGIGKVGIIDFDVHHGNGTQHIFELDPSVLYYSIHEHPSFAFPGTGRVFEKGSGEGTGFTHNHPILPGEGDDDYRKIVESQMVPAIDDFQPEFLLISTGFDAHCDDDMSGVRLSTDFFTWIMQQIVALAQRHTQDRLVSVLEGGYCLNRLPLLARNHVEVLLNA
jgi:acetoin utilization deacetylase AcuC-like enzyme